MNGSLPPEFYFYELLIYGECGCGWRCAMPEGAQWPACPCCGELVRPQRGRYGSLRDGGGMSPAYVARLLPDEAEAYEEVVRRGGSPASSHRATDQNFRYFSPATVGGR